MKKTIISIAVIATIFFTVSAFTFKQQSATPVQKLTRARDGDWVHFVRVGRTFTAEGAITGSGTWIMQPTFTGTAFHCVNTVTFEGSTLIIESNCNMQTLKGAWHVVSGTGIFENATGTGKKYNDR